MFEAYNGDKDKLVKFNGVAAQKILDKFASSNVVSNPGLQKFTFDDFKVGEFTASFSYFFDRQKGIDFLKCGDKMYVHDQWVKTETFSGVQVSIGESFPQLADDIKKAFPDLGFNIIFIKELGLRMQVSAGEIYNIERFKEIK